MTPIQTCKEANQKRIKFNFQDKEQKRKPKYNLGDIVRTADFGRVFSKGSTTNGSNKLYTITEIIHDTIPSYLITEGNNKTALRFLEKFYENSLRTLS